MGQGPGTAVRPNLVVGLGEGLLRLDAPGRARLEQADSLHVSVAGAELNVLAALVELGCRGPERRTGYDGTRRLLR